MNKLQFPLFGKLSLPESRVARIRKDLPRVCYELQMRYPMLGILPEVTSSHLRDFHGCEFNRLCRGFGPRIFMTAHSTRIFKDDYLKSVEVVALALGRSFALCRNPALYLEFYYQLDGDENIFGDWGWHRFQVIDFVDATKARYFHNGVYSYEKIPKS